MNPGAAYLAYQNIANRKKDQSIKVDKSEIHTPKDKRVERIYDTQVETRKRMM